MAQISDSIMIIGLGEIGGKALEILARRPADINKIIAADVNSEYGQHKVNNAIFGANLEGYHPNIEFVKIDFFNILKLNHYICFQLSTRAKTPCR